MTTVYLDKSQVPAQLRGAYSGTRFQVEVTDRVHIPITAGLWDGGSRDSYSAIRIADGAGVPFPGQDAAPWDATRVAREVALVPGICVVEHSIFCGKDMGLRFYLHPADAAPMLPPPADALPAIEQLILDYTAGRKSSYMGRDRYDMACEDLRHAIRYPGSYGAPRMPEVPTRAQWDSAKLALIAKGYLNKAGAITTAGRNLAGRV
jgi:hypothetical protein